VKKYLNLERGNEKDGKVSLCIFVFIINHSQVNAVERDEIDRIWNMN
jgi:hypothetical protein